MIPLLWNYATIYEDKRSFQNVSDLSQYNDLSSNGKTEKVHFSVIKMERMESSDSHPSNGKNGKSAEVLPLYFIFY